MTSPDQGAGCFLAKQTLETIRSGYRLLGQDVWHLHGRGSCQMLKKQSCHCSRVAGHQLDGGAHDEQGRKLKASITEIS